MNTNTDFTYRIPAVAGLFFLLLVMACGGVDNADATSKNLTKPFFDLKGYFDEQIGALSNTKPSLVKKVTIGDQVEEKIIEQTDFSQELQVFQRSDINRPTWLDKYQVDSTFREKQLTAVQYTALDTTLNTRLLKVYFEQGKVDSIRIRNQTHSLVADTQQDLFYCPGRNYHILSTQKTIGGKPHYVAIEVDITGRR